MTRVRRTLPFVGTLLLIVAVGTMGFVASARGRDQSTALLSADRLEQTRTLSSLANQYMQFAAKELFDAATVHPFALSPGSKSDAALLKAITERSGFFKHGAALLALNGAPLSAYAQAPGLPPAADPGFAPMRRSLLAGDPGFSSVMLVDRVPVVGVGVPVVRNGAPRAVVVGFFRADLSPLQHYNERLRYGKTGVGYMLDPDGNVIASTRTSAVGTRHADDPALRAARRGESGFVEFVAGGRQMTAAYAPTGLGGWALINEQPAAEFFGAIRSSALRVRLALIAVLAIAAAALAVFSYRRQTALARAYEYKGELLANTTHELKTPLTAIRGASMTLGTRWRQMSEEQVDMFLGMIHRRCDGLQKLVDKILIGARLEAGREVPYHPEPTEVTGVLRRIAAEFSDASPHHAIVVRDSAEVWAAADPALLDQVLGLLMENAIKYSPDGGEITLQAASFDSAVVVRVSDQGVGMDREAREHAFEPYYKASRGNAQHAGGVGLGLSIARHLVRRQGGDISVSSELGAGSVFTFTLPRAEAVTATVGDSVTV